MASAKVRAEPAAAGPSTLGRLAETISNSRMAIEYDGRRFSGAGYDWLFERAAAAGAFLLGEEHGIAENPKLAAQLFTALVPHGYRHLAIETSPTMASVLDEAVAKGTAATRQLVTAPDSRIAFYGMREEAEFLVSARAALPRNQGLLWGLDYDVAADRYLIARLREARKPQAAAAALDELERASAASWAKYDETRNPQFIFGFAGDPNLVRTLRAAWPRADSRSDLIMHTLERTLAINALWSANKGYESNLERSRLMRSNLRRYWRDKAPDARLFMKFGASHMVRGLNMSDVFDVGSMVPELVGERGTFHLLVLPGPGSQTANLDPTKFTYVPGNRDEYGEGVDVFDKAILPGKFTLFDTAPLRPIASSTKKDVPLPLWRVIHGFDAVLVMTGSHPSVGL